MNNKREETQNSGAKPLSPSDILQNMSDDRIRDELTGMLDPMGISLGDGFNPAQNDHVRRVMHELTPFRTDGHPLNGERTRMNRILQLLLELRARAMRD